MSTEVTTAVAGSTPPDGTPDPWVRAVELVQRRWTLSVVGALLRHGPLRFVDLRAELGGISPNVLAVRLRELDAACLTRRRWLAPPAGSWVYELTEQGRGLAPVIEALDGWARTVATDTPTRGAGSAA